MKRIKNSIAIALIITLIGSPLMKAVYALESDESKLDIEENKERSIAIGLSIPGTAIAPAAFAAVGLAGYTIMNIYYKSQGTAREIDDAWDKIPNKLKDPDGSVAIGEFDTRLSKGVRKNNKTGWTLDPSTSSHKGDKWKLRNRSGDRVASLDSEGRVVGK